MTAHLSACDPTGQALAVGLGSEIRVFPYQGSAPLWQADLHAPIVAVAATSEHVVVATGTALTWYVTRDATPAFTQMAEGTLGLAATGAGNVAVLVDGECRLYERGRLLVSVPVRGTAIGLGDDGFAVGNAAGDVVWYAIDGTAKETVNVADPVRGITRDPRGGWLVTAGDRVARVTPELAVEHVTRAKETTPSRISASPDGKLLAVQITQKLVMVLTLPARDTAAQLTYVEPDLRGVQLTNGLLVTGLDNGEGNWLSLSGDGLSRTDILPDRTVSRWTVKVFVAPKEMPAVASQAPSPAPPIPPPPPRFPHHHEPATPYIPRSMVITLLVVGAFGVVATILAVLYAFLG